MSTLYALSEEAQAAMANMGAMLESEDIDQETYEDTMEALTGSLTDKVISVGCHIKNLRADAQGLKDAAAEFDKRLKSVKSSIEFYEAYLFKHMQANSIEKAGNQYIDLKVKKMPDLVNIMNSATIPDNYRLPLPPAVPRSPNRKSILAALKKGVEIAGAELITNRKALSIK